MFNGLQDAGCYQLLKNPDKYTKKHRPHLFVTPRWVGTGHTPWSITICLGPPTLKGWVRFAGSREKRSISTPVKPRLEAPLYSASLKALLLSSFPFRAWAQKLKTSPAKTLYAICLHTRLQLSPSPLSPSSLANSQL